jgi:hypothetical protein
MTIGFIGYLQVITTISSYTLNITVTIAHVTSYTKSSNASSGHTAVPLELRKASEVNSQSRILSYPLGTNHTENTVLLSLSADHTENESRDNYITSSLARCCLATSYKHSSYCCVRVSWGVHRAVAWQCVDMSQYEDIKLNTFKIPHCTICSGQLGHHEMRWNSRELLCLQHYCDPCFHIYNVFKLSQCSSSSSVTCIVFLYVRHLTTHLIDNRHTKKTQYMWHRRRSTLTSFKNIVNMKTPIAVKRKAQQFPRISAHLMMAELAGTCSAVTTFKSWHCYMVDGKQLKINSTTNCNRMLEARGSVVG